jgi:hypothetical protein
MKIILIFLVVSTLLLCGINSCEQSQVYSENNGSKNITIEAQAQQPERAYQPYNSILDSHPIMSIGVLKSETLMQNPIWYTNKIKYAYRDECDYVVKGQMEEAFDILANISEDILDFSESDDADIDIYCTISAPTAESKHMKTVGEGGPSKYYEINNYSVIVEGELYLYEYQCSEEASSQLHELLHVFGFAHSDNAQDTMYPKSNCLASLSGDLKRDIKNIYGIYNLINETKIIDYPSSAFL